MKTMSKSVIRAKIKCTEILIIHLTFFLIWLAIKLECIEMTKHFPTQNFSF